MQGVPLIKALPLWTPEKIATQAWFDASDAGSLTDAGGGLISQWNDKSGNGRNATQGTSSAQPKTGGSINGLNALTGTDPTDGYPYMGVSGSAAIKTVFAVAKVGSITGSRIMMLGAVDAVGTDNEFFVRYAADQISFDGGGSTTGKFRVNGGTESGSVANAADATIGSGNPFLVQGTFDVATTLGAIIGRSDVVGPTTADFVGEIIWLEDVPSDEVRQLIEGYMAWKWGLVADLPSDHPYKLSPPRVVFSPWTPALITTQAWFDADDLATILQADAAGRVSQLTDKSGTSNHFLQATAGNQPTTGVENINGKNAIGFDGSSYFMAMGSNPFGATVSNAAVFVVLDIKTITGSYLFSMTGSDTTGNRWSSHCPYSDGTVYFDCGGATAPNRISYASGWSDNRLVMMGFYCSVTDGVQEIWEDGTSKASDASGHNVSTVGNPIVGKGAVGGNDACAVGEMIIINGTVSEATRLKIEGYLAWKWGLVSSLPSDHPYKLSPPRV